MTPPQDAAGLDRFRRDLAKASAVGMILEQAATERGTAVPEKLVQDTVTRYVEAYFGGGAGARDRFVQALGASGTSEENMAGEVRRQLLIRQLFTDVTGGSSPVTDDELRQAYDARQGELAAPERRDLLNIVVGTRAETDQVTTELAGGADFAAVAAARSIDGSSKDKSGSIGTLSARELEAGYAEAAFAAPPGAVFGPVQTRFGWNVGRVVAVVPAEPAQFERVSEQLRKRVGQEQAVEQWRAWLTEQIEDGDVRYADAYLPADPTSLPDEAVPGAPPR